MIDASCRNNFTSTVFHAPLQFRDETGDSLSWEQMLDECAGQDVDVLIHGYKNLFEGAQNVFRLVDTKLTIQGIGGRRIGFYWCGSWAAIGFLAAVSRTKKAAVELTRLLVALEQRGCRVTVETHSLGARVALQALKLGAKVDRLILTAPAVNNDCLGANKEFEGVAWSAQEFFVLWSTRDSVLKVAYRIASFFRTALGLSGPEGLRPANVVSVCMTAEVADHSGYKDAEGTYNPAFWRGLN